MKTCKACGPDEIPVEPWRALEEEVVDTLLSVFKKIQATGAMPEEWRNSTLYMVPLYKQKGDVQDCSNYRGIKLLSHTMKIWERIIDRRLRDQVEIGSSLDLCQVGQRLTPSSHSGNWWSATERGG